MKRKRFKKDNSKKERQFYKKELFKLKEIIKDCKFIRVGRKELQYERQLVCYLRGRLNNNEIFDYEKSDCFGRHRLDIVYKLKKNRNIGIELKFFRSGYKLYGLLGQCKEYLETGDYDRILAVILTDRHSSVIDSWVNKLNKVQKLEAISIEL